jgi:hypothetical protein
VWRLGAAWHAALMTATACAPTKPALATALWVLAEAVLGRCRELEPTPRIQFVWDWSRWQRQGQEQFGPPMLARWESPRVDGAYLRFDDFPAMRELRAVIRADPDLDGWMDTLGGPESSRQRRDLMGTLDWFFNRLVVDTRAYRVEESIFAALYAALEAAWLTRRVCVVDLVPLIGFESTQPFIPLTDGFQIRRMTDDELHAAIQALAVPTETPSGPVSVTVRRCNQWALTYERTVDLIGGHSGAVPAALGLSPGELADAARRLIMALRLAVGGSVLSSRVIRHFRVSLLDSPSGSAVISRFGSVDADRPCLLLTEHVQAVARLWNHLSRPEAGAPDGATGVALRRLVDAGGRTDGADRLLDLMIAAEALLGARGHDRGAGTTGVKMGRMVADVPGIEAVAVSTVRGSGRSCRLPTRHGTR